MPPTAETDDPIRRVLAHIDARLHELDIRRAALAEVRDLIRHVYGAGRPDGWLQVGTRPDDPPTLP